MGRQRRKGDTIKPWLSAHLDNREGRFIQVGNSFLLAKDMPELSAGAKLMYLCMTMESGGHIEFQFPRMAALKYGFPEATAARHVKELLAVGMIELIGSGRFTKTPNQYRFTTAWKRSGDTVK